MNVIELERALRQLRLGGMASVLETRLRQAQAETMAPIDLISCLVSDELTRRGDRLQRYFRDVQMYRIHIQSQAMAPMLRAQFHLGTELPPPFRAQTVRP